MLHNFFRVVWWKIFHCHLYYYRITYLCGIFLLRRCSEWLNALYDHFYHNYANFLTA